MIRQLWEKAPPALKKPLFKIRSAVEREKVIFESKTPYSNILVIDKGSCRYLVFDDNAKRGRRQRAELVYQSCMALDGSIDDKAAYACYFHLAWIFNPEINSVSMIGLGGGTVPRQFLRDYPEISFTAVEIDPVVVEVAYRYFALPREERLRVVVDEGRRYMGKCDQSSDLILLDAFYSRSVPYQLFTKEFFDEAYASLTAEGMLGININGALSGTDSRLCCSIYRTIKEVFPELYLFASRQSQPDEIQNVIIFALKTPQLLSGEEIGARAANLTRSSVKLPRYTEQADHFYDGAQLDLETAIILRDAGAPPGGMLNLYY